MANFLEKIQPIIEEGSLAADVAESCNNIDKSKNSEEASNFCKDVAYHYARASELYLKASRVIRMKPKKNSKNNAKTTWPIGLDILMTDMLSKDPNAKFVDTAIMDKHFIHFERSLAAPKKKNVHDDDGDGYHRQAWQNVDTGTIEYTRTPSGYKYNHENFTLISECTIPLPKWQEVPLFT